MDKPSLRAPFEPPSALTVGVEEEVMLLDAETLDLAPRAEEVLRALGGDARFKLEMPAAHLEIVLPPAGGASEVAAALMAARRDLVAACEPLGLRVAAAGVHPFAAPLGELNAGPRYASMLTEFGDVARMQLVCALQVHVAVRPADRAMEVYNALRSFLPLIAALAANAPLYEGRDTGLASVRPLICERLPQQGLAPELTWDSFASQMIDPARWWWELRPHIRHGTLEVRIPDSQATVAEAAAVVAVVHALTALLTDRCQAPSPSGARHLDVAAPGTGGIRGDLAALRREAYMRGLDGPLRGDVDALLSELEPFAEQQGASAHLAAAVDLAARGGGAARQRAAFAEGGARRAVEQLSSLFVAD